MRNDRFFVEFLYFQKMRLFRYNHVAKILIQNVEGYKERQEILLDPDIIRTMNLKHEV
jgi:hypothetical protein